MSDPDAPLRKIVKPAHRGGCIPDPAHRRDLPQDGAEVVWDHYWIGRLNRGEIVIVEPETSAGAEAAEPETSAGAEAAEPLAITPPA